MRVQVHLKITIYTFFLSKQYHNTERKVSTVPTQQEIMERDMTNRATDTQTLMTVPSCAYNVLGVRGSWSLERKTEKKKHGGRQNKHYVTTFTLTSLNMAVTLSIGTLKIQLLAITSSAKYNDTKTQQNTERK